MDNKLSELSKPVAWILHTRGGDVPTLDECYVANAEGMENIRSSALYSQEYVSALLAELEAKDKRIAEIEVSHKKLRETLAAVYNTITGGGAYTSLAGILTAVKRAYLESSDASARTVTVEGDE